MCYEISAVLNELAAKGNYALTVLDMHGNGHNLDAMMVQFADVCFLHHIIDMKSFTYDCAVLIGFHSRSNAASRTAHTFRSEICDVFLGGEAIGEYGLLRNWLLAYGIPTVFVSGEIQLLEEIKPNNDDIDYYLYPEERADTQLLCMVERLASSLNKKREKQEFKNDVVYLTFRRKYYYDFLSPDLFRISEGKVLFDNVLELFDWLFLISHLIDSANMFYFLTKNRIDHYLLNCMRKENQFQFRKDNLETLRKRNSDISVMEINKLLHGLREKSFPNYFRQELYL